MRADINDLDGRKFDIAIIGAGVNGACAAQELSAAGYRVLLVDKGDFASGSSSRSSRLLHCGLRYLAPGKSVWEFVRHPGRLIAAMRMGRLAVRARTEFVNTSAARLRPMKFCFPIFRGGPYAAWQIRAAFILLRLLGGDATIPFGFGMLGKKEALSLAPVGMLRDPAQLQAVAIYTEYQFDWPERVTVDAALDAERLGAVLRNYTAATLAGCGPDGTWTVKLADQFGQGSAAVQAGAVLNMAGIWIDEVNSKAAQGVPRKILGTKGSHIVVKMPPGFEGYGIATLNTKQEPFYCIPWRGMHYFGPTETVYEGDRDNIAVTKDEAKWLLEQANLMLPQLGLTAEDIISTWAGARPLGWDAELPGGRRSLEIHDLGKDGLPNVLAMTAGPVMMCRAGARQMLQAVMRLRVKPSGLKGEPGYAPVPIEDLIRALHDPGQPAFAKAIRHAIEREHAACLADILFRRYGTGWNHAADVDAGAVARAMGEVLGWDAARIQQEISQYEREVFRLHQQPVVTPHNQENP